MASKSKKRRRVFRASCILAALIIAGSSFAWFTSTDEVTNRLSANADYGVSIVESFAPPKMWLPGQEVNKDVYATNTGSIAAMVKEEVNGRLAITYEVDQAKWDDKCVELTEEERYAVEAGSFLAYKPSDSTAVIGNQIVTRTLSSLEDDQTVPASDDFTPDTKGLYVFRRAIDVDTSDQSETFTYDGYYFDGTDKYYKISNLQFYADSEVGTFEDSKDAESKTDLHDKDNWAFADYMGDGVDNDGKLMVASATFRKEITDFVDPVDLIYKDLTEADVTTGDYKGAKEKGKHLIATYDRGNNTATAKATAMAEAYDKALHEFEYASALAEATFNEWKTADDETQAAYDDLFGTAGSGTSGQQGYVAPTDGKKKELEDAQARYKAAEKAYNNALNEYRIAETKMKSAKKDYEDSMIKLYGRADGGTTGTTAADAANQWKADSLYGKYQAALAAVPATVGNIEAEFAYYKENASGLDNDWKNSHTNVASLTDVNDLVAFRNWVDEHTTGEKHDYYVKQIDMLIAKTNYNNEKDKCLGSAATSYADATDSNAKQIDGSDSLALAYNKAQTEYKSKYDALGDSKITDVNVDGSILTAALTADGDTTTAKGELNAADTALNDASTGAQAAYDTALDTYLKKLEKSDAKKEVKDSAAALKAAAEKAKDAAEGYYDAAKVATELSKTDGVLKIYIKLDDDNVITTQNMSAADADAKWLLKPETLENDTAVFYYTGLLDGGETSTKLIDYVYLDKTTTQKDYKNFEFDIDVNLKSAQINLDKDGYVKTDAAASELGQFAKYNGGVDTKETDKAIEWKNTAD